MMKNVLLLGFPNSGKTTLYNALTGEKEKTGNYTGVTVDVKRAKARNVLYHDLPGIYDLENITSPEEEITLKSVKNLKSGFVLAVIPANDFKRGINIIKYLKSSKTPFLIALTFYDEFIKNGGKIDIGYYEKTLGVSIIPVNANSKKSVIFLRDKIEKTTAFSFGEISLLDFNSHYKSADIPFKRLDNLLLNPAFLLFFFLFFTFFTFLIAFKEGFLGENLKTLLENALLFLSGKCYDFFTFLGFNKAVSLFLIDGVLGGVISVISFLPQLSILYLYIIVLDDSGITARIAFLFDDLLEKVGLNGRAVFSIFMAFGCTAVSAVSGRSLDDKILKKKTVIATSFIPCSARLPVLLLLINSFFSKNKVLILFTVYILSLIFTALLSAAVNKFFYSKKQSFIMELPPLRVVNPKKTLKTLIYYLKEFIIRVGKILVLVSAVLFFLKSFSFSFTLVSSAEDSMLFYIGKLFSFLFYPLGITDWKISVMLFSGLFAKEAIIGTAHFLSVDLSAAINAQTALLLIFFIAFYTPCFSALISIKREVGVKTALFIAGITYVFSALSSLIIRLIILAHQKGRIEFVIIFLSVMILLFSAAFFGRKKCDKCGKCSKNDRICFGRKFKIK